MKSSYYLDYLFHYYENLPINNELIRHNEIMHIPPNTKTIEQIVTDLIHAQDSITHISENVFAESSRDER